jgi:putative hydrolase of the HAD superfamily
MSAVCPDALLIDFGGVLTSDVLEAFDAFCREAGLPPGAFPALLREDAEAGRQFVAFEEGRVEQRAFERSLAASLGNRHGVEIEPAGLVARLTATLRPEEATIDAVQRVRAAGVPVAIVSNSFGYGAYDDYDLVALADSIIISGEVGARKPSRRIYRQAAACLRVATERCMFIDDLEINLSGAKRLGMRVFHHRDGDATAAFLEQVFAL